MTSPPEPVDAQIFVRLEHVDGPIIEDRKRLLDWICADGQFPDGIANGFTFDACLTHDPEGDCDCPDEDISIYKAIIYGAS